MKICENPQGDLGPTISVIVYDLDTLGYMQIECLFDSCSFQEDQKCVLYKIPQANLMNKKNIMEQMDRVIVKITGLDELVYFLQVLLDFRVATLEDFFKAIENSLIQTNQEHNLSYDYIKSNLLFKGSIIQSEDEDSLTSLVRILFKDDTFPICTPNQKFDAPVVELRYIQLPDLTKITDSSKVEIKLGVGHTLEQLCKISSIGQDEVTIDMIVCDIVRINMKGLACYFDLFKDDSSLIFEGKNWSDDDFVFFTVNTQYSLYALSLIEQNKDNDHHDLYIWDEPSEMFYSSDLRTKIKKSEVKFEEIDDVFFSKI